MSEMQKPSLGRIVLFKISGDAINGQDEHAAIITQVWSDTCVNLTAFPGSGRIIGGSSVMHESTLLTDEPRIVGTRSWRWPPRV